MPTLVIMSGLAGSGKTSYIKANMPRGAKYVSRDEVRFQLVNPGDKYFSKESEVAYTFYKGLADGLDHGYSYVIADATHLNDKSISKTVDHVRKYMESGKDFDVEVIRIDTPIEECKRRNAQRSGRARVPDGAIDAQARAMQDVKTIKDKLPYVKVRVIENA